MAKARAQSAPKPSLPAWPAAVIEHWPIARLIPYARNARTHSDAQIAQIAGSMREFGWTVPVLCDEAGTIIAGHGRVLAGRVLNYDTVPVMVARGWSEAQKRAYTLADNQLALKAGWDTEMLGLELDDLRAGGIDLTLIGFDTADLDALFDSGGGGAPRPPTVTLAERFGVAPFSVLNARSGWWQARKDAWLAIGIQSEVGRGDLGERQAAGRAPNAVPGGRLHPTRDPKTGLIVRSDSRSRPIPGTGPKREKAPAAAP